MRVKMFDLDEEMERMHKMLDGRERMALGVTCTEMIELITCLREAEKDATRYRWLRDKAYRVHIMDICTRHHAEWDAMVDQAMKEKGDE